MEIIQSLTTLQIFFAGMVSGAGIMYCIILIVMKIEESAYDDFGI